MQITLAATGEPTFLLAALRGLFIQDSRSANAPLFRLQSVVFSCQSVVNILKQRIVAEGLSESNYSGYSFLKGAVQHETDHNMLNDSIQKLGR